MSILQFYILITNLQNTANFCKDPKVNILIMEY